MLRSNMKPPDVSGGGTPGRPKKQPKPVKPTVSYRPENPPPTPYGEPGPV